MRDESQREKFFRRPLAFGLVLAALAALGGCKQKEPTNTAPLDQAGMWFSNVQELRGFNLTQEEVSGLVDARQAGFSDENCVELVKMARAKHQSFTDGDAIAGLLQAGVSSQTIMRLARMNQLGPWSGEALAMHLANLSDAIVLQGGSEESRRPDDSLWRKTRRTARRRLQRSATQRTHRQWHDGRAGGSRH